MSLYLNIIYSYTSVAELTNKSLGITVENYYKRDIKVCNKNILNADGS